MTHKQLRSRIFTSTVILIVALSIGLLGSSVIARDSSVEYAYTPDNLLRLHIIANSDSPFDQELKLKVRDVILQVARTVFAGAKSREEAVQRLMLNQELFLAPARAVIAQAGKEYPIRLEVGNFGFPTKTYGSVTLPAGQYKAARFVIGAGAGRNWWCVLFPPLCLWENSAAADKVVTRSVQSKDPAVHSGTWFSGPVQIRLRYLAKEELAPVNYTARLKRLLQPTLAWLRVVPTGPLGTP